MKNRSDLLQLMRFLAAAFVLYSHHTFYYAERVDSGFVLSNLGPPGVALFFVISGIVMVVSTSTLKENFASAKLFFTRRLVRVVPMYWIATSAKISIALILPQLVIHNSFDWWRAVASYFFIPTYNSAGNVQPILGVGWTLLHEMYFYLAFAVSLSFGLRPAISVSLFMVVMVLVGIFFPPSSAFMAMACSSINLYFVVGMLIGLLVISSAEKKARSKIVFASFLFFVAVLDWFKLLDPGHLIIHPIALVLSGMLLLAYGFKFPKIFLPIVNLGDSSYALYLFHTFYSTLIMLVLYRLMPQLGSFGVIWLSVLISIPIAHAIYKWFEKPITIFATNLFIPKS